MIAKNIKHLRKLQGLTQGEFADKIGINRPAVGSYEEGRAEPRISTLQKIALLFNVSLDALITEDLSTPTINGLSKDIEGKKLRILSITTDREDKEYIQLVPQKASAGYTNGYADPQFIEELPQLYLPMLDQSGTHRAFEIKGDSMLPLPSGAVVVGRYVANWNEIKDERSYVIVTQSEGTVYKRIQNKIYDDGTLLLVSDNKTYTPYPVSVEDISEVWEAKMIISSPLPKYTQGETTSVQTLTDLVMNLQKEITEIKKKI